MGVEIGGILGFVNLIADIWTLGMNFPSLVSAGLKLLWTILIFLFPVPGLIIWLTAGPRSRKY